MKFSVLIPTRNRLQYLKYAVETVLRQDYDDWELIISDNDSEEDIAGYAHSLNDPRIKYYRTDRFVPVTDNWNNALHKSSGEYVIMLGDDDCLMRGYFTTMSNLIKEYAHPDVIYTKAYLYAYPGVMAGFPDGYLQLYGCADFFDLSDKPFWLDISRALNLVEQSMNFKSLFGYNSQFSLVKREFIDSLQCKGNFFQSPYPDFYATNVLFLKAKRILIYPHPMVTIGICPKSFGFFFFNQQESAGVDFLHNMHSKEVADKLQNVILPGVMNNTFWLLAMETIRNNYSSEFNLCVNYRRYRFIQIGTFYKFYYADKRFSKIELQELQKKMTIWERLIYGVGFGCLFTLVGLMPLKLRSKVFDVLRKIKHQYSPRVLPKHSGYFKNILEVYEKQTQCLGLHT